jgi:hypothetical protein
MPSKSTRSPSASSKEETVAVHSCSCSRTQQTLETIQFLQTNQSQTNQRHGNLSKTIQELGGEGQVNQNHQAKLNNNQT